MEDSSELEKLIAEGLGIDYRDPFAIQNWWFSTYTAEASTLFQRFWANRFGLDNHLTVVLSQDFGSISAPACRNSRYEVSEGRLHLVLHPDKCDLGKTHGMTKVGSRASNFSGTSCRFSNHTCS